MDDELPGGVWRVDEATRSDMRLTRIRRALDEGAWERAVVEAEELLDEEPSHPQGLFLLGEALLELADFELARLCYQQRVDLDGGDPASLLGLAISAFQSCDLDVAIETAREVVRRDPGNAEAHYYLGLALERLPGRGSEAMGALSAAAQLEPARYPLPMQLDLESWKEAIHSALDVLPTRLQLFYDGLDFRLEDLPDLEELRAHDPPVPPTVGAMYVGEPPEEAGTGQPSAIRLFLRNLGRSPTPEDLVEQLAAALTDEALHWLGLPPEALDESEPT